MVILGFSWGKKVLNCTFPCCWGGTIILCTFNIHIIPGNMGKIQGEN